MMDICRGCGESFEGHELFDVEGYDGSWCYES